MPEWIIEEGIGETRAALVEVDDILEARVRREGVIPAGTILEAKLVAVAPRMTVEAGGEQFLLPRGAPGISEGGKLHVEVTREALGGSEPWKRGLARVTEEEPREAPALADAKPGTIVGWDDLLEEARSGIVDYDGGQLRIEPTAAMTMIDVDGWLVPDKLSQMAAWASANAIRRLDLGGATGIDFPSLEGKEARQEVGNILDMYLAKPFERTAMNGFGFVQVVRPKSRASLIDLAADRAAFEARALLRRASNEVGAIALHGHPAVLEAIRPDWLERLSRKVGGAVTLQGDAAIAMSGAYAQKA
ncbi:ribonuclease E/G [Sphingomicrobium clamense]|uniref:Ribonuclease E/G n=1 Tax=Sphingomicrobium clamense TaxID=2851013 RepID=A0ABS6V3M0_9SPHN|nr:ribonuclease E/G [Sphingomicrobium sp. B8]MBW0144152.1 ribonuclease E/G [Sphingomicrobium sp. B8]